MSPFLSKLAALIILKILADGATRRSASVQVARLGVLVQRDGRSQCGPLTQVRLQCPNLTRRWRQLAPLLFSNFQRMSAKLGRV